MTAEVTYQVEKSFEATTLDYLVPYWYAVGEPLESKDAAEEALAEVRSKYFARNQEPCAFRISVIKAPRPEGGYADPALEEEFAASQRYWSDLARVSREKEEAEERYLLRTRKGMPVRVVKGRKVPIGTEGWVFWSAPSDYRAGEYRIGFKDAQDTVFWTSANNVEVIEAVSVPEKVGA